MTACAWRAASVLWSSDRGTSWPALQQLGSRRRGGSLTMIKATFPSCRCPRSRSTGTGGTMPWPTKTTSPSTDTRRVCRPLDATTSRDRRTPGLSNREGERRIDHRLDDRDVLKIGVAVSAARAAERGQLRRGWRLQTSAGGGPASRQTVSAKIRCADRRRESHRGRVRSPLCADAGAVLREQRDRDRATLVATNAPDAWVPSIVAAWRAAATGLRR
jgi:hypothetical protein